MNRRVKKDRLLERGGMRRWKGGRGKGRRESERERKKRNEREVEGREWKGEEGTLKGEEEEE